MRQTATTAQHSTHKAFQLLAERDNRSGRIRFCTSVSVFMGGGRKVNCPTSSAGLAWLSENYHHRTIMAKLSGGKERERERERASPIARMPFNFATFSHYVFILFHFFCYYFSFSFFSFAAKTFCCLLF